MAGPLRALFAARLRLLLQYRAAALAGLATQIFFGLVRVMIYQALYASAAAPPSFSLDDVVSYVWLGQAFFALLPWSVDRELATLVKTGNVAYELLRPVDLYAVFFVRNVAARVAPAALRAAPLLIIAALFLGLRAPASAASLGAGALALAGAVLLGGALTTLVTITFLWTVGDGIHRLYGALALFASGLIIPLPLMPEWVANLLGALPLSAVADKPFRLYTGQLPASALGAVLLHQLVWTVLLVGAGRLLLARAVRRVVVAGG
jgi:ABC-2 type transport system permease protein